MTQAGEHAAPCGFDEAAGLIMSMWLVWAPAFSSLLEWPLSADSPGPWLPQESGPDTRQP